MALRIQNQNCKFRQKFNIFSEILPKSMKVQISFRIDRKMALKIQGQNLKFRWKLKFSIFKKIF